MSFKPSARGGEELVESNSEESDSWEIISYITNHSGLDEEEKQILRQIWIVKKNIKVQSTLATVLMYVLTAPLILVLWVREKTQHTNYTVCCNAFSRQKLKI